MSGGYSSSHPGSNHHFNHHTPSSASAVPSSALAAGNLFGIAAAAAAASRSPLIPPPYGNPFGAAPPPFPTGSFLTSSLSSSISSAQAAANQQRIKLKRARQRVDAGEPRNCYSSIQNSNAIARNNNGGSNATVVSPATASSTTSVSMATSGTSRFPTSTYAAFGSPASGKLLTEQADYLPHMQNAWLRLQALKDTPDNTEKDTEKSDEPTDSPSLDEKFKNDKEPSDNNNETEQCVQNSEDGDDADTKANTGIEVQVTPPARSQQLPASSDEIEDEEEKELAEMNAEPFGSPKSTGTSEASPKSKRKSYQPQQVDQSFENDDDNNNDEHGVDDDEDENDEPVRKSPHTSGGTKPDETDRHHDTATPAATTNKVNDLLAMQRQWYVDWLTHQHKKLLTSADGKQSESSVPGANNKESVEPFPVKAEERQKEIKTLGQTIKSELIANMSSTVDKIIQEYIRAESARLAAQQQLRVAAIAQQQRQHQQLQQQEQRHPAFAAAAATRPFYLNHFYSSFPYSAAGGLGFSPTGGMVPSSTAGSIFPSMYGNGVSAAPNAGSAAGWPNAAALAAAAAAAKREADGFSLVMPRKKRSKVTDTRLNKIPVRGDGVSSRSSPLTTAGGYYPPTMVGHPLYGSAASFAAMAGAGDDRDGELSPGNSDDLSDMGPFDGPQESTLTPMHLRKAKLMFFYTRYPSSTLLKTYFPDIRFNKNTTAQLVKWFSNFREFYYIQMEKYARQAMAEGIKRPDEISVSVESEIYKVLNQHYNRNNHIQVPTSFRAVVEATLREFFVAIQAGRDVESSWKKQIYKVIARLDDTIPDYFKNPNFLEQLE